MNRFIFGIIILIWGCSAPKNEKSSVFSTNDIKYAKGFHIEKNEEGSFLVIDEPWPKAPKPIKYSLENVPNRIVCTSTSHLPFFEMLGEEDLVVGFPNINYISSKAFIDRANEGLITDLGPDGSMNMELLLGINPDAVIAFDMGGESQTLDKIKEAGIPVYYNSDFLEQSPLGRAEWIKFFGALLNKQHEADSIFSAIENEYLRLKELASKTENKPSILSGVVYGDTWFLPGGNNWAATFFNNAGGEYLWDTDTTTGWMELSFEAVYEKGHNADYWIGTSTLNSMDEMKGQDDRYAEFEAFKDQKVYNYSKKIGPNGGYDFFESGYSRPDLVLSDLIKVLHPELLPKYETVYFQQLN
ncbi:iron complex transport system substrate-binding protein [Ekhidna lutea]|uniref:Iron complex transport system substrate-binding protein n=1 Tax=Ekhidna lutea TaxID=447679 RepID=A0A239KDC6_EKHLU|nr:ABC transporter substrate-binding protein [Ekhidna lutea]SNT15990.1 iron complex transport system substrate-binding protein [Ekhidna lutea]